MSSAPSFAILSLLICFSEGILVGRLRSREKPESNVVRTSRLFFPPPDVHPRCKTDLGDPGRCVDVRFCYAAVRAIAAGNQPARCGWVDPFVPAVCCHPEQVQHPKRVFRPYRRPSEWRDWD